jgi:polyferredoxin
VIARLLVAAILFSVPTTAAAHGEHGGARSAGEVNVVSVHGYQVELLSHPSPIARGQESQVIAKIVKNSPLKPAAAGRVLISVTPAGAPPDFRPAPEVTWAGSYSVPFTPTKRGIHQVRVALAALEGERFDPPLLVDFQVVVGTRPGMGAAGWTFVAVLGGVTLFGLYLVSLKARLGRPAEALNLLAIPWLRRLLTLPALLPSLQVPLLGMMGIVVLLGLTDVQDGGVNLATKLTWTIWWAGIIFTFFLVGRAWCLACPFGALNEWAARIAAPVRRLPRPFRNIWWATGMFVLLTWADEQLGVVRSPAVTAWIVVFFAGVAVCIGIFFERRSFCRYLCPIGGLIGMYSMTAPVELRAKERAVCTADREKGCFRGNEESRGCPMFEFPATMDRNTYCTFCAECVKGCGHDNLVLRFRAWGKDLWASGRRALDEAYLAVVLVGLTLLVTAVMLSGWAGWIEGLSGWLPSVVRSTLKPVTYLGVLESVILLGGALVIVPLIVYGGAVMSERLAGDKGLGVHRTFVVFSYMFVPNGLAMHLAHNVGHLLIEGPGIVPAVQRAVAVYTPFSLGAPDWHVTPLAPEPVVGILQMGLLVGFFVLSLVAGHRLSLNVYPDPRTASRALLPMAALALLFTVVGIVLLNQPMGMRHGM